MNKSIRTKGTPGTGTPAAEIQSQSGRGDPAETVQKGARPPKAEVESDLDSPSAGPSQVGASDPEEGGDETLALDHGFVLEPILMLSDEAAVPQADVQDDPASRRIVDLALPKGPTELMIRSISEQLARIVNNDFDFRVIVRTDEDNIQIQKLTMYINLLLENVRRSLDGLTNLAQEQEQVIAERTRILDLVISGSNDGVWIWKIAQNTTEFSARWSESLGASPGAGGAVEDWIDLIHPEDKKRFQISLRAHLQGVEPNLDQRFRIRHGDGTFRWVWCRGRCLRDEAGRPTMMAGTLTDIHNQRSIDRWTGMPNDDALRAHLDGLLAAGQEFGVLLIGLPALRDMQDDHSMAKLAPLRRAVVSRLSSHLPYDAFLACLPGDFYMVVLSHQENFNEAAVDLAAVLFEGFNEPFDLDIGTCILDPVIGASANTQAPEATSEAIITTAWTSYRAARRGGATFNLLRDAQLAQARRKAGAEALIKRALAKDWFVPFFQPIVEARTMRPCGFEVLCRLNDPEKGILPTAEFLGIAQDMGAMPSITRVMLDKSLATLADWQEAGGDKARLFLCVNIDARDVISNDFVRWLTTRITELEVPAHRLILELRETSLTGDLNAVADKAAKLHALGIKIALDDFGTGYSSLTYLNQLNVDWIKIDRSFVTELKTDGRKRSMVRMISTIADQIGAQVCVDGVETDEQLALLEALQLDLYQGFLFGKPMPLAEAGTYLDNRAAKAGQSGSGPAA